MNLIKEEPKWERQPFTVGEFLAVIGIPISFVIIASIILFIIVIRAGG